MSCVLMQVFIDRSREATELAEPGVTGMDNGQVSNHVGTFFFVFPFFSSGFVNLYVIPR